MSSLIDIYSKSELESNIDNRISRSIQFWLFLISNILSIFCCIFVLFNLLFDRTLRHDLRNHVILILLVICLIYELIDIPFILYYYRFEKALPTTSILYRFWSFVDVGLYTTLFIIFAWATIERHILVFHDQCISTEKKRFYVHYLPLILLTLYSFIWYSVIILFPSCDNINNKSDLNRISYSCILYYPIIKYFDLICHQIIPLIVIVIFSIALIVRVQFKKTRFSQTGDWTKQQDMIIQILSISILYFLFCGPWIVISVCSQFTFFENIGLNLMSYAYFISYYFIFLLPFVCCASLPEVRRKMKKVFCSQRSQ